MVESALAGNIESFGKLYTNYYSSMVAVAYSVLAEHNLAEDAAQKAFAKALVNLKNLRKKEKFAPWLASICKNVAKDLAKDKLQQINTENLSAFSEKGHKQGQDHNTRIVKQAINVIQVWTPRHFFMDSPPFLFFPISLSQMGKPG